MIVTDYCRPLRCLLHLFLFYCPRPSGSEWLNTKDKRTHIKTDAPLIYGAVLHRRSDVLRAAARTLPQRVLGSVPRASRQ